ncbi:MAG TPA: hypothetical protein VL754_06065 [Verrucomicrobiae bacterium]|nr:hypothetical protein [Verrucomicrobiae bacterium]
MTAASYKRPFMWILAIGFAGLALLVFIGQNRKVGFETGHHGWVSSHTLSIIGHASSDSGFVGYSVRFVDDARRTDYDYFDRSPLFFSAGMNRLLDGWTHTLSERVYFARQAMNLIFLATLAAAFFLLFEMSGDPVAAAGAALLAFSGSYFMYYKDMIHFEQPALLGIIVLLCAVLHYRRGGAWRWLYGAAIFAASIGSGYISLTVLLSWAAVEFGLLFYERRYRFIAAIGLWLRSDAFRALALSTAFLIVCLSYNIAIEARLRGISWRDTSIIESATRRSGLGKPPRRHLSDWNNYVPELATRLTKAAVPYAAVGAVRRTLSKSTPTVIIFAAIALTAAAFLLLWRFRSLPPIDRPFYLVLLFSAFIWLIPMRRHVAPHEYTAMYFAGLLLAFFEAVFIRMPARLRMAGLGAAVIVFAASDLAVNADHSRIAETVNSYTYDFEKVLERLRPGDRVFIPGGYKELLPHRPYAAGFYLSRQDISPLERADFAVSRDPGFAAEALTPDNHEVFLFRLSSRRGDEP